MHIGVVFTVKYIQRSKRVLIYTHELISEYYIVIR